MKGFRINRGSFAAIEEWKNTNKRFGMRVFWKE